MDKRQRVEPPQNPIRGVRSQKTGGNLWPNFQGLSDGMLDFARDELWFEAYKARNPFEAMQIDCIEIMRPDEAQRHLVLRDRQDGRHDIVGGQSLIWPGCGK
jgi:hypothetical protein